MFVVFWDLFLSVKCSSIDIILPSIYSMFKLKVSKVTKSIIKFHI